MPNLPHPKSLMLPPISCMPFMVWVMMHNMPHTIALPTRLSITHFALSWYDTPSSKGQQLVCLC